MTEGTSGPTPSPVTDAEAERIRAAARAVDHARRDLEAAVHEAREAGLSWSAVGQALGTSRQAAWERFARGPSSPPAQPSSRQTT
jgi:predicted neutral ceramidase superfamily lipid hydrolase